jgi:hypothetical protein
MDWRLLFARDSALWTILFYVGMIATGLASLTEPGAYGIPDSWMPYIRLIAFVSALVGGKMGLSYASSKREITEGTQPRVDPRKYVGAFVALYLTAGTAACAPKTRHVLVTADTAIYETLKAISNTEITLSTAGVLSPAQSKAINQKLLPVVRTGKELNDVLGAWTGGTPMPSQIPRLVKEIADLLDQVLAVLPDSPAKAAMLEAITRAQQAALGLLLIMGQSG